MKNIGKIIKEAKIKYVDYIGNDLYSIREKFYGKGDIQKWKKEIERKLSQKIKIEIVSCKKEVNPWPLPSWYVAEIKVN